MNIKETYGVFTNKMEIFSTIKGCRQMRGQSWNVSGVFSYMMEVADQTGNFVSDIIEKAINGQEISDKQAWCVAFFAEKNGFTA